LALSGIDADFSYALFSRDSVTYLSAPSNIISKNGRLMYPVELEGYLPDLVQRDLILELRFMDMNSYFLSKLNGLTIPSLIFFVALILVVIWILRSFYWQRKLITTTNEFINNLTHELKTPVFSIGLATKILEAHATAQEKPIVDLIRQETERLKNHIDKVLDIGNLEQGKKIFEMSKTDFRPILSRLCKEFEALSSIEQVDFSSEMESGEFYINAAANHLENAINNILDNAKKYSENPVIKLSAKKEGKKLKIVISDNGIGIDKKNLSKVFNKYYRVTNGNLYKTKGYGLGLSYAKRVVEGHRGKITIDSILGQGTTVTLTVPLIDHGKEI
jgi:two-component system phosphate regulon sensor histidine kinase PhoR